MYNEHYKYIIELIFMNILLLFILLFAHEKFPYDLKIEKHDRLQFHLSLFYECT